MAEALRATSPKVTVLELQPQPMIKVRLRAPTERNLASIGALIGATPSTVPNEMVATPVVQVIWQGPNEWLIVGRTPSCETIEGAVADGSTVLCVNQGDGRCTFDVTGLEAADLLAKGTSIDLQRGLSSETSSAMTMFAQINTLIYRPSGLDGYRLIFDVSLRNYVTSWFREALIEFN